MASYRSGATGEVVSLFGDSVFMETLALRGFDFRRSLGAHSYTSADLAAREVGGLYAKATTPEAADRLVAVLSRDMEAGTPGTLTSRGWSQRALVPAASVASRRGCEVHLDVTVALLDGWWCRPTLHRLSPATGGSQGTASVDLPLDLPFDLGGTTGASKVVTAGMPALLRLVFYGPCSSPYVVVSAPGFSNRYGVSASCGEGERIVIDPTRTAEVGESVYRVGSYGQRTNLFAQRMGEVRGSGTYPFERLRPGVYTVAWNGSTGVDVELVELSGGLPWS